MYFICSLVLKQGCFDIVLYISKLLLLFINAAISFKERLDTQIVTK